ncbi:sigma-54-dependent transcriptional regulator family protein [Actinacidiphila oryziradicis]|uniref:GAF domain-containing protein n=1 Tax=Actinacidiphila oryziradicis TaxID=2571141 RepID=A0A4U0S4P6_9ACTN|nr:hypothetical protein [Actinacidiphila oryziradicis]TKA03228.1 hypothetical protein FCI23_36345 [Actinacidiphila oryziradicis]
MSVASEDDERRLRGAHERFVMSSQGTPSEVRRLVADSWRRSATTGVSPDGSRLPPVRMAREELAEYRCGHPLAALLPLLRELLGDGATDDRHIFAVGDADGTLLWVEGDTAALDRAERMRFVEGAVWTEAQAGTNAPGTALAVGHPVQILGAEHYSTVVQPWSCAGTRSDQRPLALAAVRAAARAAEAEFARRSEAADGQALRVYLDRLLDPGTSAALLAADGRVLHATPDYAAEDLLGLGLAPGPGMLWDGRPVTVERLGPGGHCWCGREADRRIPYG